MSGNAATEAERQRCLIESLFAALADASSAGVRETGPRALRGLRAYRANAEASSARALAAAFPTVQMLLGDEDFDHLAHEFWRADPPLRGDLGEWGDALPKWIAGHRGLAAWPYLADCARLDWALHRCERAQDAVLDADSIARLGDTDPSQLVIELAPGLALVESAWPIAAIREAHAAYTSRDEHAFDAVRDAIAQQRGECAWVSREGFKGVACAVDPVTARWIRSVLRGDDLAHALDDAGAGFDFTAWLTGALQSNWVKGIHVLTD
jgi:hypothetical protein